MDLTEAPQQLSVFATLIWTWAAEFLPRLGSAILILIAGFIAANWISRSVYTMLQRVDRLDETLKPFIRGLIRYGILIIVAVAALGQLGVQTASILAALGAIGLAIGLALQGTLSNLAAGIMLLWLRPFAVGDYIETSSVAGTVEEVGIFASRLKTWDGVYKFVPNAQLWNTVLTNYSRNATRLVLLEFGIAYENDIAEGRRILSELAAAHPNVLKDPAPVVVPLNLGDSAVVLQMRAWAPNANFWATRWELTESGKAKLEEAGITIPYPQRVVHIASDASDADKTPPAAIAGASD